jgi:hypothetical protein
VSLNTARMLAVSWRVILPAGRRRMLILVLAVGLCGLLMITFSLRLLHPPIGLVDVGAPGDAYVALSFYRPEQAGDTSFRWSGAYSALALPTQVGALILSTRLHTLAVGAAGCSGPSTPVASDQEQLP